MILHELVELSQRVRDLPPVGCWDVEVSVDIHLDREGRLTGVIVHKSDRGAALPRRWYPFIDPTNKGKPSIGVHKLEHILGSKFAIEGRKHDWHLLMKADSACSKKAQQLASFSQDLVRSLPANSALAAVAWRCFLAGEQRAVLAAKLEEYLSRAEKKPVLTGGDYAAVLVEQEQWWTAPAIVRSWQTAARTASDEGTAIADVQAVVESRGQCLVCGQWGALERLMPAFDGLVQSKQGLKLVPRKLRFSSFNCAAYLSRGKGKAFNAPVCQACADRAAKGWNGLMLSDSSRELLDDEVLGFWGELQLKPWGATAVDARRWQDVLSSSKAGKKVLLAPEGLHVLGLGAHEATAYVTFWLARDAERASAGVLRWWRWQKALGERQTEAFTLTDLVMALRPRSQWYVRKRTGERSTLMSSSERRLWRALLGVSLGASAISPDVLAALARRFSAELEASRDANTTPRRRVRLRNGIETGLDTNPLDRLVLLNICLCSMNNVEELNMANLSGRQQNAFNAGRIFNLICYAQREAIGETGKTILVSNASLAATRPASIIPALVTRLHSVYLPKLRRDKPRLATNVDKQLSDLLRGTELPLVLSTEQMGWFWKGFYHRDSRGETQ